MNLRQNLLNRMNNNSVWIFGVLFLFFSYLLLGSTEQNSYADYVIGACKLYLLFSPVLLFAFFRQSLLKRFSKIMLAGIWSLAFLVIPLAILLNRHTLISWLIPSEQYRMEGLNVLSEFPLGFFVSICSAVLITELAIWVEGYYISNSKLTQWLGQISIDKLIARILVLLAISLAVKWGFRLGQENDLSLFWVLCYTFLFLLQYLIIIATYYFYYIINKHVLIPHFLNAKGIVHYGFSVAGTILVFYPIFVFFIQRLPMVESLELANYFPNSNIFANDGGASALIIIVLSVPVIVSNQWFRQSQQIAHLEKEKSEAELNLLKQQINPHFFFNTLNNLYALSITKDEHTPEVILQLSELMRYVIYKGKEDLVPLEEEIKYIKDYIELRQINLHKKLDFRFDKEIADPQVFIPPLIFITFVENAFKHGIENAENDCFLHLDLKSKDDSLTFTCRNSFEECSTKPAGIGLENLRKRLELRYPNQYKLTANTKVDFFEASVNLNQL